MKKNNIVTTIVLLGEIFIGIFLEVVWINFMHSNEILQKVGIIAIAISIGVILTIVLCKLDMRQKKKN